MPDESTQPQHAVDVTGPKDTPLAEAVRQTAVEGELPQHLQKQFAAASLQPPNGARTFSTGSGAAFGGSRWQASAAQLLGSLAARHTTSSWRGFAGGCMR